MYSMVDSQVASDRSDCEAKAKITFLYYTNNSSRSDELFQNSSISRFFLAGGRPLDYEIGTFEAWKKNIFTSPAQTSQELRSIADLVSSVA